MMAAVAAGFFLMLKLGFILHNDPQPAVFANTALTGASIVVIGVVIVWGIGRVMRLRPWEKARIRREHAAYVSQAVAERDRRVAELAANPATAKYAPLVERGEDWSDENIAYFQDPQAVATCAHLQPIERAMREAGIASRRARKRAVIAACRIDLARLQDSFHIAAPVRYAEYYAGDRSEEDFPTAFIICDADTSMIHTLHPDEAGAGAAPVFPAPGG
jgi:hypothetical protein